MRSVRSELVSVAMVLTAPAVMLAVFPSAAVRFRPQGETEAAHATAAFVTLSPATEAAALRAAKSSWQGDVGGVRHMRAELSFGELPKTPDRPVLSPGARTRQPAPVAVGLEPSAYLPSRAAPAPERIPGRPVAEETLPFPKKDLLKID